MAEKHVAQPCHVSHDPKEACMLLPFTQPCRGSLDDEPHALCMQQVIGMALSC